MCYQSRDNIDTKAEFIHNQLVNGAEFRIFKVPKDKIYSSAHKFNYIRNRILADNEVLVQYAGFPVVARQKTTQTTIHIEALIRPRKRYSRDNARMEAI